MLQLYNSMYDMVEQVNQGKMIFSIFNNPKSESYKYLTLITSDKGVKKGSIYGWSTLEKAKNYIKTKIDNYSSLLQHRIEMREKAKEQSKQFADSLQVGDILVASWGYEALWYDFYKVVDKKGQYVYLVEMNQNISYEGCIYGCCSEGIVSCGDTPKTGEIIRRKINDGYVKITSYAFAKRWDGKAREQGNWH